MLGFLSGMVLSGALASAPSGRELDQVLLVVEVVHDGHVEFAQGVSASRDKPGKLEVMQEISHLIMSCGNRMERTSKPFPTGYIFHAQLGGGDVDAQLEHHVPRNFDSQIMSLKVGECIDAAPSDQVVFSWKGDISAETNGEVKQVDLGQGYVLRYSSRLQRGGPTP